MSERPDLARRGFLSGALLTSDGRHEVERRIHPRGPLPPAVHISGDSRACHDCPGPCVESCAAGIVRRHDDQHASAGLPYLEFSAAACTFCGDCVDACPACDPGVDRNRLPARLGLAHIDAERCIAFQGVICASCRLACDARAVGMDVDRRPVIEVEACNGCGACVGVCPGDAIAVAPVGLGRKPARPASR